MNKIIEDSQFLKHSFIEVKNIKTIITNIGILTDSTISFSTILKQGYLMEADMSDNTLYDFENNFKIHL